MPPNNDEQPALPMSLADHAAAFTAADTEVQRLERDRKVKADQLAQLDAEIDAAKDRRDQAHAGLRESVANPTRNLSAP